MLVLATLLAVAAASLALYAHRCLSYWARRGVPQLPGARFPLGHLWRSAAFRTSFGEACCDLYWLVPPHMPLAGAYFLNKPAVVLRDPELIKKVLVKDFHHFHDRGFYVNEDIDPLMGHLFLLSGDKWRFLRNKLSPTFTSGKMKMMFPTVEKCARELSDVLSRGGRELEFRELLACYSTDVIASCAFGLEAHCLQSPDDEFRQWGKRLFSQNTIESLTRIFCVMFPRVAAAFRIRTLPADIDKYFTSLVKNTMDYRDSNGITRPDFLQLLMGLRNKNLEERSQLREEDSNDIKLSFGDLAAQCAVFFVAGFETSSTTMSFALHELVWNQDIQKKLQQEIDETLKTSGGQLTYDSLMNMPYLDKVVSETLRKYPPVPVLNRQVTQEYLVPDTEWLLEEGTAVIIPVMSLQHDPQYFPDPERFDPERFSEEEISKRHSFTYLPFGDGPRICIGMRFGLMQTKIGLAWLLSRYNIETCGKTVKEFKMDPHSFVLSPVSGIWLCYSPRSP